MGKNGQKNRITLTAVKRELCDVCNVSEDSIKKWMDGRTGPSDLNSMRRFLKAARRGILEAANGSPEVLLCPGTVLFGTGLKIGP